MMHTERRCSWRHILPCDRLGDVVASYRIKRVDLGSVTGPQVVHDLTTGIDRDQATRRRPRDRPKGRPIARFSMLNSVKPV